MSLQSAVTTPADQATSTRATGSRPAAGTTSSHPGLTRRPRFAVDDIVVYPAQGVAEVTDIEVKQVSGVTMTFYHLQVRGSGVKIIVPVERAEDNGMRPVATERDQQELAALLRVRDVPLDRQTWNRRYRSFMEKIRTGVLLEVAEVFRDLALLRAHKQLSHGERQMMKTAKDLLVRELAVAQGLPDDEVAEQLESMFKQ